jgi:hypothetical protein
MRLQFRPSAERLEAHVLLSTLATVTPGAALPAATDAPIVETLTTNKSGYRAGEPVRITLSVTNTTKTDLTIASIKDGGGFTASQDFAPIWHSDGGKMKLTTMTVAPGQSHSVTVSWNGRSSTGGAERTGSFVIDNTLANNSVNIQIGPVRTVKANASAAARTAADPLTITENPT